MKYVSSTSSWKPWRWERLDLIFTMRNIYINSNLNQLKKFTSSSKSTKFKDTLPWNISQIIMKTAPIRIVISYAMKRDTSFWVSRKVKVHWENNKDITRIKSWCCKFRDLVPLLVSRDFHLGAKDRLYSACARSVMLYGSETWPVEDEGVNRQERHDAEMVRWMYVTAEDKISTEDLKTRLKLKSRGECLQDTRLQWFGYLERMDDSAWSSKCRTFKVSGDFPRWQARKTWRKVIRSDL